MPGQLAPAIGGHLAVPGIEADDDVATKGRARVLQKAGVLDGCGADDDVAQAGIQVALNGVKVANTATELHVHLAAHLAQDLADGHLIFGVSGESAIQIDQMQPSRTLGHPAAGHQGRVFAKRGRLRHVALLEANTVTVFEIDCRN